MERKLIFELLGGDGVAKARWVEYLVGKLVDYDKDKFRQQDEGCFDSEAGTSNDNFEERFARLQDRLSKKLESKMTNVGVLRPRTGWLKSETRWRQKILWPAVALFLDVNLQESGPVISQPDINGKRFYTPRKDAKHGMDSSTVASIVVPFKSVHEQSSKGDNGSELLEILPMAMEDALGGTLRESRPKYAELVTSEEVAQVFEIVFGVIPGVAYDEGLLKGVGPLTTILLYLLSDFGDKHETGVAGILLDRVAVKIWGAKAAASNLNKIRIPESMVGIFASVVLRSNTPLRLSFLLGESLAAATYGNMMQPGFLDKDPPETTITVLHLNSWRAAVQCRLKDYSNVMNLKKLNECTYEAGSIRDFACEGAVEAINKDQSLYSKKRYTTQLDQGIREAVMVFCKWTQHNPHAKKVAELYQDERNDKQSLLSDECQTDVIDRLTKDSGCYWSATTEIKSPVYIRLFVGLRTQFHDRRSAEALLQLAKSEVGVRRPNVCCFCAHLGRL